ncbi:MAG: hypothetical protein JXA28_03960 [Bacteroidetes bacterium]|nr:hypothetical protein [Bacteroidota bacterium]
MTYLLPMNHVHPFPKNIHRGGGRIPVMLALRFVFAALLVLLAAAVQAQPCPSPDAAGPWLTR